MTSNTQILTAFNNHFEEFVDDIVRAFPDDIEIAAAANAYPAVGPDVFNPQQQVPMTWSN